MAEEPSYGFPTGGIHRRVCDYVRALPDLGGKIVVDIPCGDGRATHEFRKRGAVVRAYDLYPATMRLPDVKAEFADLSDPLPIESASADYVVCQEGIEHLSDPFLALQEFSRILKPGGRLLITTPNYSHLRARLFHFLNESPNWDRMPCTEIDGVWFSDHDSKKTYFGHLFLLNVQRLRTLLAVTGFRVEKRLPTNLGRASVFLGLLLYPLLAFANVVAWRAYRRRIQHVDAATKDRIFKERIGLNLSPTTLFSKHIFWIAEKELDHDAVRARLKAANVIQAE